MVSPSNLKIMDRSSVLWRVMHPSQTSVKGSGQGTAPCTAPMEAPTMTQVNTTRTSRNSAKWLSRVKNTVAASTVNQQASTVFTVQARVLTTPGKWRWGRWRTAKVSVGDLDKEDVAPPFLIIISLNRKRRWYSCMKRHGFFFSWVLLLVRYAAKNLILYCQ